MLGGGRDGPVKSAVVRMRGEGEVCYKIEIK